MSDQPKDPFDLLALWNSIEFLSNPKQRASTPEQRDAHREVCG
jgi:hypothetical protein